MSQTKILRLVRDGALPTYRNPLDKREKRIPVSALQELVAGTSGTPPPRPTIIGVADIRIQSDEMEG